MNGGSIALNNNIRINANNLEVYNSTASEVNK